MTFTKNNDGESVGGQKILANFPNDCVWFLGNGIFSYSCVCPHVQLVNVFFSVICKDFLLSTGF